MIISPSDPQRCLGTLSPVCYEVESGRPFGGVMTMIRKELRAVTETVLCDERYVIIRIANYLIVNVYLPYVSTANI